MLIILKIQEAIVVFLLPNFVILTVFIFSFFQTLISTINNNVLEMAKIR